MDAQLKSMVHSCTTCAKAKAKCVWQTERAVCERCARLKKDCHLREPMVRKKKPLIKATRAAQLEKLENKIESLVNALSTSQNNAQLNEYGHLSPPTSQTSPRASPHERAGIRSAEFLKSLYPTVTSGFCAGDVQGAAPNGEASPAIAPSEPHSSVMLDEAEQLLDRYQRLMAPSFPFVVIQPGITVRALSERKPVLLRAITTVAMFHNLPRQEALVTDFVREIADRVMIKSQKSLDILQGMLVFVCWYHPHLFWSSHATNVLHLAIAQTVGLGIDRPPQQSPDFKSVTARAVHGPSLIGRIPHLDEHRALLGVFSLISMLSCCLKKLDPMAPTRWMEECANNLLQAAEYESDTVLVQTFRVQSISHNIHTASSPSAPMSVYIRAFTADLERARRSTPCKGQNVILQLQDFAAETSIWALSLNELHENRSQPLSDHLEDLYRCITASKGFINVFFSLPTSTYLLLPFAVYGFFAQLLITLIKLASLEVDGWDIRIAVKEVGFLDICDGAAKRFEDVCKTQPDGISINNKSFNKWGSKVRWMKQVYLAKFAQETGVSLTPGIPNNNEDSPAKYTNSPSMDLRLAQLHQPDDTMSSDLFNLMTNNLMDDNFWNSLVPDWDLGLAEPQGV